MTVRRHLWPEQRIAYRSAIYLRATARSMIREHNEHTCTLDPKHLGQVMEIVTHETRHARNILADARQRALGYQR